MLCGYKSDEIYELFKKYCSKIKYIDFKNIGKILWGLITRRELVIDGLNSGEVIEKIVRQASKNKGIYNINEIKMPLIIPSVDLNTGELYMFSSMKKRSYSDEIIYINDIDIAKAVRASCSYPGIFSPCKYKNIELIDGGIRENIPWKEAKANGAKKVLCVRFEGEGKFKKDKNIIDILSSSLSILKHELYNYEIDGADYVLNLKTMKMSLLDCSKIDYLYRLGYEQTNKYIKIHKVYIK